jgi:acetylornithine deacetylase
MNVKETLAELVAIDSVSSRSNTDITDYLERRCKKLKLKTKRFSYRDELGIDKTNLVALGGSDFSDDPYIELALVGHTDTVPYDPAWTEATKLTERDGKLYGRGSCDTKGFIAAALTAVENLDLSRLNKPLALIFTNSKHFPYVTASSANRLHCARSALEKVIRLRKSS